MKHSEPRGRRMLRVTEVRVESGTSSDLPAIRSLMSGAGLPLEDLEDACVRFWVARDGRDVVGAVGLEGDGQALLLRSLAVARAARNAGVGSRLLARAEREARESGARRLFLLTQTAESFLGRLGYVAVERASVPQEIKRTAQFRSLCPATAACMAKSLEISTHAANSG